jgi:transposase
LAQIQVITGPTRRRSWSSEQKQELVATAFAPGAVVTDVARRADVSPTLLYRWRRDLRVGAGGFAEVVVAPTSPRGSGAPGGAIEIDFIGAAHIRIPPATPPALAVAVVKALQRCGPVRRSPTGEGG